MNQTFFEMTKTVKEHYDTHLAAFYSWMAGDFETASIKFLNYLNEKQLGPVASKVAIDLGCGHGIQSKALAQSGYTVTAIDFNRHLLNELRNNCNGLAVSALEDDLKSIKKYKHKNPELILCWGDTLSHLDSLNDLENFVDDCCDILPSGGKLLLSFREYPETLHGDKRFIPVKSDENRILTCFLELSPVQLIVTDMLYEKTENGWQQKISSYHKLRLSSPELIEMLENNKMTLLFEDSYNGMTCLFAVKD